MAFLRSSRTVACLAVAAILGACGKPEALAPRHQGPAFSVKPLVGDGLKQLGTSLVAAYILESSEPRFGGWSGLAIENGRLTAVSDRGYWFAAVLPATFEKDARFGDIAFGSLIGSDGEPLAADALRDAEEVVRLPNGDMIVSFERDHRLWLYPAAQDVFAEPPIALERPPGLDDAPYNGGAEAVALLPDGRLLVIQEGGAEESPEGFISPAWIGEARGDGFGNGVAWSSADLRVSDDFKPTAVEALPNGDLIVLERRFSVVLGFANRLRRIDHDLLKTGLAMEGEVFMHLSAPPLAENFEGLAVVSDDEGTRLHLISDDNYNGLQKTVFVVLELPSPAGKQLQAAPAPRENAPGR